MFFKGKPTFIKYLLYYNAYYIIAFCVFALICITSWGTNAVDKCDEADRFFNCTKDGSFDWGGLTYKCPTDKVCNSQYVLTKDDGPPATTKCEP